jgi:hypothetical protein
MSLPMMPSKIVLSDADWGFAASPDFILTKNRVIEAVYEMFGSLAMSYVPSAEPLRAVYPEALAVPPKISRGEQYEGMPWVMLDYPRFFSEEHGHFAIRSFFWWGHFFSIQLHLSGQYAQSALGTLQHLQQQGWIAGATTQPWSHQLPNSQWTSLYEIENKKPTEKVFGKAAKKIPISQWALAPDFFTSHYGQIVDACTHQQVS